MYLINILPHSAKAVVSVIVSKCYRERESLYQEYTSRYMVFEHAEDGWSLMPVIHGSATASNYLPDYDSGIYVKKPLGILEKTTFSIYLVPGFMPVRHQI